MKPKTFCAVAVLLGAYVIGVFTLPKLWMAEIVNGVLVSTAIAILAAYGPVALDGIRNPAKSTRQQYLALGICAVWACILGFRLWSTVYLNVGHPAWMEQHWLPYAMLYMCMLAGVFTLRAPATLPGNRTKRSWRYIAIAMIGGIVLASILLAVGRYR
jgi:NO-binding membrane sensor protein with MHYT domain